MKRFIFALVCIIITITVSGQSKTVRGDVVPITDDLSDNILNTDVNTSAIETVDLATQGVQGYYLSFSEDTMIVTDQNGVSRKFVVYSKSEDDVTPPTFNTGNIGERGYDSIYTDYSESITWTSPTVDPFSVTIDGVAATLSSVYHNDDALTFKLSEAIEANQIVVLTYTQPGTNRITDAAGNRMASFSTGIPNTIKGTGDTIDALAWHKVNNNLNDEYGNYNGTADGSPTYDGSIKMGGSHSINMGTSASVDLGVMDLGDSATIMFWWYGDRDPGAGAKVAFANRITSTNNDGVMVWISSYATDNGYIWVYTGNGSAQAPASAGQWVFDNTWTHIAIALDHDNGIARIYANGVNVTSDSTTLDDYAMSGNAVTWGADNANNSPSGGRFDDMRIFDRILTDEQIKTIYNNPEIILTTDNKGDDEIIDDSITIVSNIDLSTTSAQTGLSSAELFTIYPNTWYLGGESDSYCETAGVVDASGEKWLRSYHDMNTCCTESQGTFTNGGSGILWRMYFDDDHADYSHGYLTYRAKWPANYADALGSGAKMPGFRTTEDVPSTYTLAPMPSVGSSVRTMSKSNVADSVDVQWYIYPHLYADYTYGRTHSRDGSGLPAGVIDRIPVDEEVILTIRWYSGTVGSRNGFIEWFRNGVLIDQWTGLCFTESSNINFNILDVSTFAGGGDISYYASEDTYWDIRNVTVFQYAPGSVGVPAYNVPSNPGRVLNLPAITD